MRILKIRARHVLQAPDFYNPCKCPIALAAQEKFGTQLVHENVFSVDVSSDSYKHRAYGIDEYEKDKRRAKTMQPDEVVRTLKLIELS